MKRLLILTDAITAPLYIPRMRYLVTNLAKRGWACTVISERVPNIDYIFTDCKHLRFAFYTGEHPLRDKIVWFLDKLFPLKERAFERFVRQHVDDTSQFDYILCSAFHTHPLPTAARLARDWHLPLVIDLRDIAEQWGEAPYMEHPINTPFRKLNRWLTNQYTAKTIRQRNKALKTAKTITTVSPWHKDFLSKLHPDVQLIYNGFDTIDFAPKDIPSNTFDIVYTGKIYDFNLRDPHLLFEAVGNMRKNDSLPNNLRLCFYCEPEIYPALQALAQEHHISDLLQTTPYVPKEQIPALLHRSSIVLQLTNKACPGGSHGIMTTKFFEALGVEKPVLCVRSDEECLAAVIAQTNAGIAATNVEEVTSFIQDKYREWKTNGFTHQHVTNKEQFSRGYQASQFEQILIRLHS